MKSILEILEGGASHPSAVYFIADKESRTTFAELWGMSERAARFFSRYPVAARVAGILAPTPESVACLIGAMRAGVDFVSMQLRARAQTPEAYRAQLTAVLGATDSSALVVDPTQDTATVAMFGTNEFDVINTREALENGVREGSSRCREGEGSLIQLSSGTTDVPKTVSLRGGQLASCPRSPLNYSKVPGNS